MGGQQTGSHKSAPPPPSTRTHTHTTTYTQTLVKMAENQWSVSRTAFRSASYSRVKITTLASLPSANFNWRTFCVTTSFLRFWHLSESRFSLGAFHRISKFANFLSLFNAKPVVVTTYAQKVLFYSLVVCLLFFLFVFFFKSNIFTFSYSKDECELCRNLSGR